MKLIDKDALVAEIERLITPENGYSMDKLLDFIDTLEAKEVDLNPTLEDISIIRQIMFDYNRQVRNEVTIPKRPTEFCDKARSEEIISELEESQAETLILLGDIPLKKGESDRLNALRAKVVELWCGTKKELPSKLVSLIQEGKDNGWVNITQEKIDNSKWNK